jgi:hypothetical protein
VGGVVLVRTGRRLRRHPAARFALRPRMVVADPDAPDLAGASRAARFGRRAGVVHCRLAPAPSGAALLFAAADGGQLRVPLAPGELEERLAEAREVLRGATPPAVLAVGPAEPGPGGRQPQAAPVAVKVSGDVRRLTLEIGGERFGAGAALGWRDAALAILAASAPGAEPRVAVADVRVGAAGAPADPLVALWAASVSRRRLHTFIRMTLATYQIAAAGR